MWALFASPCALITALFLSCSAFSTTNLALSASCAATCLASIAAVNSLPNVRLMRYCTHIIDDWPFKPWDSKMRAFRIDLVFDTIYTVEDDGSMASLDGVKSVITYIPGEPAVKSGLKQFESVGFLECELLEQLELSFECNEMLLECVPALEFVFSCARECLAFLCHFLRPLTTTSVNTAFLMPEPICEESELKRIVDENEVEEMEKAMGSTKPEIVIVGLHYHCAFRHWPFLATLYTHLRYYHFQFCPHY
ncbi:hypothetical protein G2W53_021094 [Senna tora]|uniref:Uncharacterized protein n=1 Tax=Senna tora TaxID=362788 RepID=A0A834WGV8_9FABA|nr:hypothetical protein G2W53_021094 [Senna tora]